MIHKVNAPSKLILINTGQNTKNQSGASTGEDFHEQQENHTEQKNNSPESKNPQLSLVSGLDQPGLTEVIENHLEFHPFKSKGNHAGLSIRYLSNHGKTKGLLLNKKA